MNNPITKTIIPLALLCVASCSMLDSKDDLHLTDEMLETRYYHLSGWGYRAYSYVQDGFDRIDGNLFATVSDEAQYVSSVSESARFNQGTWNQYHNPDDCWDWYYQGIHDVNYFLENTVGYKEKLAQNRDTITVSGNYQYHQDVIDMERMRNEAVVLKAYYYFELIKRYGGVPFMDDTFSNPRVPRATYDEVVSRIVSDIDSVSDLLVESWINENLSDKDGRLTRGAALAIKSRALLYAASPLNNPDNDAGKWEKAAKAAHDIIALNRYSLSPSYRDLFLTAATNTDPEVIWAKRQAESNSLETANYPISTRGGHTGVCPSYNLVKSYGHKGPVNPDNWFDGIDPRCTASIVGNMDSWNGRVLQIYPSGTDDPSNPNTSVTGFYLKKFLNEDLNLVNGAQEIHSWILFRYAEILLNYAEAMNEAYGPDNKAGFTLTAREAVNQVRTRAGMPDVEASSRDLMREAIRQERRVELAFEEHRFWDLLRWKTAGEVLNQPVEGVTWEGMSRKMQPRNVASRVFDPSKMYLYPIPQTEIVRTSNTIEQNPNW